MVTQRGAQVGQYIPKFQLWAYEAAGVATPLIGASASTTEHKMQSVASRIFDYLKQGRVDFPIVSIPAPMLEAGISTQLAVSHFGTVTRQSLLYPSNVPTTCHEAVVELLSPYDIDNPVTYRRLGGLSIEEHPGLTEIDVISLGRTEQSDVVVRATEGFSNKPEALMFVDFVGQYLGLIEG